MERNEKSIKGDYECQEFLAMDEPIIYPPEITVKTENTGSSNEESGEETAEEGHQDRKNLETIETEMDEKCDREPDHEQEQEEAEVPNRDTEEDLRKMNGECRASAPQGEKFRHSSETFSPSRTESPVDRCHDSLHPVPGVAALRVGPARGPGAQPEQTPAHLRRHSPSLQQVKECDLSGKSAYALADFDGI